MRGRFATTAMLATLIVPRVSWAAGPPDETYKTLPCRPTIACTADLVPPGALEIEAGYLFRRLRSGGKQWTFPVLAKLTAARWAQLQLGSNGFSAARGDVPAAYFDDVTAGVKLHFHDQTEVVPSLSASATASIPFGNQEGYVRTYDALVTGYVTKDVGPLHVDLNLGFNAWRIEGSPLPQEVAALALSANLPFPFGVMGEVYYFTDAAPVAPKDGGFLFAFTHSPRAWLMFDFGADVGFFPGTRAYSAFVGLSVIPAVLWSSR